jgi:hypothetical protein
VDNEKEFSTKWSNITTEFLLQILLIAGENLVQAETIQSADYQYVQGALVPKEKRLE